jgi:tRNA-splicing ligase RtcB
MLKKINDFLWEIEKDESIGMKVPIHIYANEKLANSMQKDRTLKQATNAASLPSIVKHMVVMPDGHEGYGLPVGGVVAFPAEGGIISPGSVGFDVNCGVRLIKTNLTSEQLKPKLSGLMDALMKNIPSGVGSKIDLKFSHTDLERIAIEGVKYVVDKGFGFADDIDHIEEYGTITGADFGEVSQMAKKRGLHQLGTLGAGNHFIEVQRISEIFDKDIAKGFGLEEDNVTILIHSGSRGFGHQICSDYLRSFSEYQQKNNLKLPDPELSYAPINTTEADSYLKP